MLGLGTPELIIILVIILLLFGGTQLPKLARSLGGAAKELRDGLENGDKSDQPKKKTQSKK
jgi:sec-independent protein translocase protein TatA